MTLVQSFLDAMETFLSTEYMSVKFGILLEFVAKMVLKSYYAVLFNLQNDVVICCFVSYYIVLGTVLSSHSLRYRNYMCYKAKTHFRDICYESHVRS